MRDPVVYLQPKSGEILDLANAHAVPQKGHETTNKALPNTVLAIWPKALRLEDLLLYITDALPTASGQDCKVFL